MPKPVGIGITEPEWMLFAQERNVGCLRDEKLCCAFSFDPHARLAQLASACRMSMPRILLYRAPVRPCPSRDGHRRIGRAAPPQMRVPAHNISVIRLTIWLLSRRMGTGRKGAADLLK